MRILHALNIPMSLLVDEIKQSFIWECSKISTEIELTIISPLKLNTVETFTKFNNV